MVTRKTAIAVDYLRMLRDTPGHPAAREYVRNAYKYDVPVGRIIIESALPAVVVITLLEGGD